MGQKIHPGGVRVGVIHDWKSNWMVPKKEFAGALIEDIKIREHILKKLSHAGLSDILIRKDKQRITIDIYTARPGIVIGKSGVEVDALRKEVHAMTQKNVHININEIKRPELDAKLVAQSIAEQLQIRVSSRRAMKRSLASAIRSGAAGVKVQCSGRLGGAEMSRSEQYSEGRVPLHTIRADIDYGFVEAKTPTGRIGVKVWINKGEIMPEGYGGVPGRGRGETKGQSSVQFGDYGIKALEDGWITNRQIEAARIAMTRKIKRGGKVWINIFPDKPFTKKPAETRMGKGKGSPEGWVAVVKPGRVMFELSGVPEPLAKEALRLAGQKLPVKTKFVRREGGDLFAG